MAPERMPYLIDERWMRIAWLHISLKSHVNELTPNGLRFSGAATD